MLKRKLRELEDHVADHGWRIKKIPWTEPGTPTRIHHTGWSLIATFVGIAIFLGAMGFLLKGAGWLFIPAAILGLLLILIGRLAATKQKFKDWQQIEAKFLDHEIRKLHINNGEGGGFIWRLRVLCDYESNGKRLLVTPEIFTSLNFQSEQEAEDFVQRYVSGPGLIWVDPHHPLHTGLGDQLPKLWH